MSQISKVLAKMMHGFRPRISRGKEFCRFSQKFLDIGDDAVSERYHYGELRLTILNFYAKFLLRRKFQYERVRGQYGVYFARFSGALLVVLGIFSLVSSAMQVELAVETLLTSLQWVKGGGGVGH